MTGARTWFFLAFGWITIAVVVLGLKDSSSLGRAISRFKLVATDGEYVSLSNYPASRGIIVVFTCNHCPFAKLYPKRLNDLQKKYASSGVALLAINSMDTALFADEDLNSMARYSREYQFTFPYLQDASQSVAKEFGAKHTPQAFVLWREVERWTIRYSGAIDDNGAESLKVQKRYVEDAVERLLNNSSPLIAETKSFGCAIQFRK